MNGTVSWDLNGMRDLSICVDLNLCKLYEDCPSAVDLLHEAICMTHNLTHDRKNPSGTNGANEI